MLSERIFFVIERITDILNLEKDIQVRYSDDVRKGMMELKKELSGVLNYLTHVENGHDQELHDHYRFYVEISSIAVSSDEILDSVTDNVVDVNEMNNVVKRVHNSYQLLPSQPNYYFNTTGNTNMSYGQQRIGPINISIDHAESSHIKRVSRPKSYGHVPNSDFVGFNHEIQTLLAHLLQHDETHIVGIVGMGGAGKTTLAKQIYRHPQIMTHFNHRVWVCISQSWDKTSILNSIWRQATQNLNAGRMDDDEVVENLYQHLSLQTYLVILDDIWSIDAWYDISPALPHNSGSKVVVTTRNIGVPKCMDTTFIIIEPKTLNGEESFELFRKRTLRPKEEISPMLRQLGAEMVEKCKGLPLAITALAGILRIDKSQSSWERINNRLAHSILNMKNDSTQGVVKEVLGLSYNELPRHLKPCVLYLQVFPEDYEMEAKRLIKMWIAECLIETEDDDQVCTAEIYLDEMVQRCIIEVVKTNFKGQVSKFRIHDLIRQMFVDIDHKSDFVKDPYRLAPNRTIDGDEQNSDFSSMSESRSIANLERILEQETNSHVRSVIFLNDLRLSKAKFQCWFEKFRLLRVLILSAIMVYERGGMPEEIGNLIHLRYLELGGLIAPAESIGNLENLWILDLRNIDDMWEEGVKINLCELKELRHLYFPNVFCWKIRFNVGMLKKLKTLWNIRGGEWLLSQMPVLSAHLQELGVRLIRSNEQLQAVFRTPSITSNNLQNLKLGWDYCNGVELHDLNILSKCKSLKKLWLNGAIKVGTLLVFPPNLIKLKFEATNLEEKEVMNIISKSCPNLKILFFGIKAYKGSELICNANSFLQLKKLTLTISKNLRLWIIETSAMPNLHHLTLSGNDHLDLNPEGWTFISNIPQLTFFIFREHTKFEEKLRLIRKDDQNSDVYGTYYVIVPISL